MSQSLLPDDYSARFDTWTKLLDEGNDSIANSYYFDSIVPAILPLVKARSGDLPRYEGLISLLGFTPETTVLAYKLLEPESLAILHTPETASQLDVIRKITGIQLSKFYHESFLHDDEHTSDIFAALKKAISRFPEDKRIGIEMTGGKKTMGVQLATAVVALKEIDGRSVDIIYLDYDVYLKRYRKPAPESLRLLVLPQLAETAMAFFKAVATRLSTTRTMLVDPVFSGRGFPIQEDLVFVLMPFGSAWSARVWKRIQEVCRKLGLQVKRADELVGPVIMEDIWQGICQARVILADLTGRNPNVFYELGLAHTLGKRVVLLTQNIHEVPFDLIGLRCVVYEDNVDGFTRLEDGLERMLRATAPI